MFGSLGGLEVREFRDQGVGLRNLTASIIKTDYNV